jgi:hypothetical protein
LLQIQVMVAIEVGADWKQGILQGWVYLAHAMGV